MKYIAYGSNMVRRQMAFRCPDARRVGTGHACSSILYQSRGAYLRRATASVSCKANSRIGPVWVWMAVPAAR